MKKHSLLIALTLILSFNFQALAQSSCLVAQHPFNGNANDFSTKGNHATANGTNYATDRDGKTNSAIKFNGSTDWVRLGTDADFAERTISLWFQVDTFIGNGDFGLVFTTDNANLKYGGTGIAVDNSGTNRISAGVGANIYRYTSAKPRTWYHFAITVDSKFIRYYLNGNLMDSLQNNSFTHSADGDNRARLGCSRKNDRYFKGSIDQVEISNCALTKTEIKQSYTLSSPLHIAQSNFINIYPNPVTDNLNLDLELNEGFSSAVIYNTLGEKVSEIDNYQSGESIDVSAYPNGIYLITITNGNKVMNSKFIKI